MMAATAKPRRNVTARPAESVRTEVDSRRLASELASNLRGEVRFDAGSRALYAKDYSVYQHLPIGVIVPRDVEGVVAAVEVCRRYGAPILARGCGTSPQRAMLQRGRDHRLLQIPADDPALQPAGHYQSDPVGLLLPEAAATLLAQY